MDAQLIEFCTDANGILLWAEHYVFRRLSAVNELFIRDNIHYKVISCIQKGIIIYTVVKKIK